LDLSGFQSAEFIVESIFTAENLLALVTLSAMEIVLGIDNVVFIAILTGRLPPQHQRKARTIGLSLAMILRVALLLCITWIMRLTEELFKVWDHSFTGRDLILLAGGMFLIGKATFEIHHKIEGPGGEEQRQVKAASFAQVIIQILMLDIVFSLDSVITAVGMAQALWVMIVAVVLAAVVMLIFAGRIAQFIERHPTMKMLALSFLLLIGVMLVVDGFGAGRPEGKRIHIDKGYIYFAMAFSLAVELLNLRMRKAQAFRTAA
jgi:predicted tellurium resistance membrane protein TerC